MEKVTAVRESDTLDRLWEHGTAVLRGTLYFLCGFILSGAGLFSFRVPLGAGLVAATSGASLRRKRQKRAAAQCSAASCGSIRRSLWRLPLR